MIERFDHPVVGRCQLHKLRNVRDRLPERLRGPVQKRMRAAYHADSAFEAQALLEVLTKELDTTHPGAAGSLREGLAETRIPGAGGGWRISKRKFTTMTADLLLMADWLAEHGITRVVLDSTGDYWRPVFSVVEGPFACWLLNARHMESIPGSTSIPLKSSSPRSGQT